MTRNPNPDDWEPTKAIRESPDDHPNDHIDVVLEADGVGNRVLRFDIAGHPDPDKSGEWARYRYEMFYDSVEIDTEQVVINAAARYIWEEHGLDAEVAVEEDDLPEGVVGSAHIKELIA